MDRGRLLDLVTECELRAAEGSSGSPEEICRDCPELLEPVRQALARLGAAAAIFDPHFALPPAEPLPAQPSSQRWKTLRPHARGGLGEILVAEDSELRREVALKRVRSDRAGDPAGQVRLRREAELTSLLEHPGVVPIYGMGADAEGRPYYVMRLVTGRSLRDAVKEFHAAGSRDNLAFRQLLQAFATACKTVAFAHSRGVIHRDIKPANIMLGQFGETLVVDWGLARRLGEADPESPAEGNTSSTDDGWHAPLTMSGAAMGTPGYMAPEQVRGDRQAVGTAADIYAMGATLYDILTGVAPLTGEPAAAVLARTQSGDIPPPRRIRSNVPAALDAVCRKAMALKPEDRYTGALAMSEDVERWLADEPVSARPESWGLRMLRTLRRYRTAAASGAVAAAAAVIVFVLAADYQRRQSEADDARLAADEARLAAEAEARERDVVARAERYSSLVNACRERRSARRPGWTWQNLDELKTAAAIDTFARRPEELSDELVRALTAPDVRPLKSLDFGMEVGSPMFSPDGKVLAVGEFRDAFNGSPFRAAVLRVVLYDTGTWREIRRLEWSGDVVWKLRNLKPDGIRSLAFDADGRRLAAGTRSGRILMWDLAAVERADPARESGRLHTGQITGLWFADGASLISATGDDVRRTEIAGWRTTAEYKAPAKIIGAAYDPVRRLIMLANHFVFVLTDDTLALQRTWIAGVYRPAIAVDGTWWAGIREGSPAIFDMVRGRMMRKLQRPGRAETRAGDGAVGWLSGERLLVSIGAEDRDPMVQVWEAGSGRLVCAIPVAGSEPSAISTHGNWAAVTMGRKLTVLEAADRPEGRQASPEPHPVLAAGFAPGGTIYAIAADNVPYAAIAGIARIRPDDLRTETRRQAVTIPDTRLRGRLAIKPLTGKPAYAFADTNVWDWGGDANANNVRSAAGNGAAKFVGGVSFGRSEWTDVILEFDCLRTSEQGWIGVYVRHGVLSLVGVDLWRDGKHSMRSDSEGGWCTVAETPAPPYKPEFHVRISAIGDRIECRVDGELVLSGEDRLCRSGLVHLVSHVGASEFRNLRVTSPDGKVLWQGPPVGRYECGKVRSLAFAPDGNLWAVTEDDTVVYWDHDVRGTETRKWSPSGTGFRPPASNLRCIVAGKRGVSVGCRDGGIFRLTPEGRLDKHFPPSAFGIPADPGAVVSMALSPDERSLHVAFAEAGAWTIRLDDLKSAPMADFGVRIVDMTVSADGSTAVFATADDRVHVVGLSAAAPKRLLTLHQPAAIESVACSADGSQVAVCLGGDHALHVVDVKRLLAACTALTGPAR